MVKFSVIYLSYRPGSYDLLADGLANQTCQNYELICVDELVQFHQIRRDYLLSKGVKLSAILPSKKPCFKDMAYGLICAYNSGVMMSKGDYIIIMNDFTWIPPDALAKWEAREDDLNHRMALSGVGAPVHLNPPTQVEDPISSWKEGSAAAAIKGIHKYGNRLSVLWRPEVFELFYSIFSYDLIVSMNGFPECYDHTFNNQITPVIDRVQALGGKVGVDENNRIYMVEHRRFEFNANPGRWHLSKRAASGSRTTLIEEPNCFNLKTHARGTISNARK